MWQFLLRKFLFFPLILILSKLSYYVAHTYQTPQIRYYYPSEKQGIALTIDDAPSSKTPLLLELLRKYNIKATFFVIGECAQKYPHILEQIRQEGHLIGNHDLKNRKSVSVEPSQFEQDLLITEKIIRPHPYIKYFRPGCGWYSQRLLNQLQENGYKCVLGNVYPLDPQIPSSLFIEDYIMETVQPGSIIILHDSSDSWFSQGRMDRTVKALDNIIPKLLQQGYTFKRLDEMED